MSLTTKIQRFLVVFLTSEDGTTAAEFALVLPIFLTTIFATIYLSAALAALSGMQAATEQAARCLSVNAAGACTTAAVNTYATRLYQGPGLSGLSFAATKPACGNSVTGSGTFSLFTGVGKVGITLSTSACYPVI